MIFNPSFPHRFTHMLPASGLTVAFLIVGLSAWQQLRGFAIAATPKAMRAGLTLAAVLIPRQIAVGDMHGLNTLEQQPQKIAAMEGVWQTERDAPLLLFARPDEKTRSNHFEIGIPNGASWILRHDAQGEIQRLDDFTGAHPPAAPLFFGFRTMVGTGMLMLATSWLGLWLYKRNGWRAQALARPLLWLFVAMSFSGWVATVAGWYVTEIGRQPFIVFGLVKTAEVISTTPAAHISLTLALYVTLYLALIVACIAVLKYMAEHPVEAETKPPLHSSKAIAKAAHDVG